MAIGTRLKVLDWEEKLKKLLDINNLANYDVPCMYHKSLCSYHVPIGSICVLLGNSIAPI